MIEATVHWVITLSVENKTRPHVYREKISTPWLGSGALGQAHSSFFLFPFAFLDERVNYEAVPAEDMFGVVILLQDHEIYGYRLLIHPDIAADKNSQLRQAASFFVFSFFSN